jgi:hypothetical protein
MNSWELAVWYRLTAGDLLPKTCCLVLKRLELQPKFDDKLHKNNQQWEDVAVDYKTMFPEDARDKNLLRDAVWDKEYLIFKDWCKQHASFQAGMTSGLGRDQQDTILAAKQGIAHDIFLEFHVQERPIACPTTLLNAGNVMGHAATMLEAVLGVD